MDGTPFPQIQTRGHLVKRGSVNGSISSPHSSGAGVGRQVPLGPGHRTPRAAFPLTEDMGAVRVNLTAPLCPKHWCNLPLHDEEPETQRGAVTQVPAGAEWGGGPWDPGSQV